MAISDQFSYVNIYAPFLLEDELFALSDKPSNLMDFRIKTELSETIVRQACSYIFEGMPLTRLSMNTGDNLAKVYNNKVLPKEIPRDSRTGRTVPHEWKLPFYHSMYSELVIENSYQLTQDEQLAVYCTAINANYIKVQNNSIIGLSPLLEHQIDIWKLNNNTSTYTNKDLFGTDEIRGEVIQFTDPSTVGGGITSRNYTYTNIDVPGKTAYGNYSGNYYDTEYVAIYPVDAGLAIPKVGISRSDFSLQIRKEGGSTSKTTVSNTNDSTIKVTSKTSTGPIRGTAKPNWTVYVTFPGDIVRGVPVAGNGYWYCDYPTSPYTAEELSEITVSQQETQDTSVSTENNTPAIVQRTYGLPILEFERFSNGVSSYNFYSNSVKTIAQRSSGFDYSYGGECFRHVFTKDSPDYQLTGVYVGRSPEDYFYLNDKFLSWPGSIIQETGVDVLLYYKKEAKGVISSVPDDLVAKSSTVVSVSVGSLDYLTSLQTIGTSWLSEYLNNFKERIRIPYEASYDPVISQLRVRWEINAEIQNFSSRFKTSWESEPVNWFTEDLTIRYEVSLPEDRIIRDFLTASWDKELTQSFSNIVKTVWEKEKTFFITQELETSWDTVLVDTVILKPFYVQLWDPVKRVFSDCISFNVYGDSQKMEQYILNGELRYLFSNPPKYELIMFDYNLQPYSDVFLTQLQDPILEREFSDIPSRFSKIGNYTIKDVNRYNSFSLDVIGVDKQLNEYKSYWIPEVIEDYAGSFLTMADGKSKLLILDNMFKEDHHEDVVELDLIILDGEECCFTQSSTGSRCSPY